jgi:hypothetical protein
LSVKERRNKKIREKKGARRGSNLTLKLKERNG